MAPATSGRQPSAIFILTLRHRSHKRLDRISPNLVCLIYISSNNFGQKMTSSTTSVREPSPSLCYEIRRAVYSLPRRWALAFLLFCNLPSRWIKSYVYKSSPPRRGVNRSTKLATQWWRRLPNGSSRWRHFLPKLFEDHARSSIPNLVILGPVGRFRQKYVFF